MEHDVFAYYLQTIYNLHRIPLSYGYDGEIRHRFEPYPLDSKEAEWAFMPDALRERIVAVSCNGQPSVMYYIYPNMIFLGLVQKTGASKEFVFVGPATAIGCQENELRDHLFQSGLSPDDTKRLTKFLMNNKLVGLDQFLNLLTNIHTALNGGILYPSDFTDLSDRAKEENPTLLTDITNSEEFRDPHENTALREEYTKKLAHCIKTGNTDTLTDLWQSAGSIPFGGVVPVHGSLRTYKNMAIGAICLAVYHAEESGLSQSHFEGVKQYYIEKAESAQYFDQLSEIIYNAIIELTERVRRNSTLVTENPTLNRIIAYIQTNITEKLTAQRIAEDLGISPGYIFLCFKETLHKTLSTFILEEKIKKAVHLLLFTDKPLLEISTYLSFSSQSYFQKSFQKVMGVSPTEYRKLNSGKGSDQLL